MWYPGVLANASWSSEYLAHRLHRHVAQHGGSGGRGSSDSHNHNIPLADLKRWVDEELVRPGLGISDATEAELAAVARRPAAAQPALARMVSDRAQVGWSTHGHSAVDVNVYGYAPPRGGTAAAAALDALRGNVENTDVGRFLREYLGVDVDAVTRELRRKRDEVASAAAAAGGPSTKAQDQDQDQGQTRAEHEAVETHRLEEEEAEAEEAEEQARG